MKIFILFVLLCVPQLASAQMLKINEVDMYDLDLEIKTIIKNTDGSYDIKFIPKFLNTPQDLSYFKVRAYCNKNISSSINLSKESICGKNVKYDKDKNEIIVNVINKNINSSNVKFKVRAFDSKNKVIDYIKKSIYIPSINL